MAVRGIIRLIGAPPPPLRERFRLCGVRSRLLSAQSAVCTDIIPRSAWSGRTVNVEPLVGAQLWRIDLYSKAFTTRRTGCARAVQAGHGVQYGPARQSARSNFSGRNRKSGHDLEYRIRRRCRSLFSRRSHMRACCSSAFQGRSRRPTSPNISKT